MRILVTGAGRGGTNLVRAVVKELNVVNFTVKEEDRELFNHKALPENYGTKLTTENKGFTIKNIAKLMNDHNDLCIVFSLRNPVDNCMAKMVRTTSSDSPIEIAIATVKYTYLLHKMLTGLFPRRVYTVKMDDLILRPDIMVDKIAQFLRVKPTKKALEFYKYNVNSSQIKRHGRELQVGQIGIYKRWDTAYDGFFKNRKHDVVFAAKQLSEMIKSLEHKL